MMTTKSEKFNKKAGHPLQTWEWGEFRESAGNEVLHTDHGLITVHHIPFTSYKVGAFIRGPKPTAKMIQDFKSLGKKEKLIFIKLEPFIKKDNAAIKLLRKNGSVPGKTLFTPTSFWIDLKRSEDELLKSFHPKTRYNIRYAERKGIEVIEDNSREAFENYIRLMRETVERQKFYAHSEKYHRLMWEYLNEKLIANREEPIARLLIAKHEGEVLTAWIVFVWKDFLYYPYGAWSGKKQNLQPNSAMMWAAIKLGKSLDLTTFDLWGREGGKGFTRFKEGFNPQVVEFLGTWDLVINKPLYYLYRTTEAIRWPLLRLKSKLSKPTF